MGPDMLSAFDQALRIGLYGALYGGQATENPMAQCNFPSAAWTTFHQTAYVTNDFDRALDMMSQFYGLTDFMEVREISFPAGPGRTATINMALSWRGDTQYEIIQPLCGDVELYRRGLPAGDRFGLAFHHFCQEIASVEELERLVQEFRASGVPVMIENGLDGLTEESLSAFIYADFTASLGHYMEFIYFTERGREFMESVPRHPLR
jgi:hypothetical protein